MRKTGVMKKKAAIRPYRSLAALGKSGSTTRVLNLSFVADTAGHLPEYHDRPFFRAPQLNRSLVLKHRLRPDDPEMLDGGRGTATKVVVPLDPGNLAAGGASFLIGQTGWLELLEQIADARDESVHDRRLLECLDTLPSFDPFLLREHLGRLGFRPADCYFAISPGDREQMRLFVQAEIGRLIERAFGGGGSGSQRASTAKLVDIMLAADVDERLDPLRLTLRLEPKSYREGIFSWKGFLYYKWSLASLLDHLQEVMRGIGRLQTNERPAPEAAAFLEGARGRIQKSIQSRCRDVSLGLQTYDEAYSGLIDRGDAIVFRDFLLSAPGLFLELGERIGMISHVATYWRYRFPPGAPLRASSDEVVAIFKDFEAHLANPTLYLAA
ncbi:hypothetical protein [Phenylobacterium sp. SCN 70-31]|uniref:hypothetical protein n=1 Tax=Phenylobacterium sp. SCN 70-31 TaxID=1660129 RepID=UPI000B2A76A5|nr:hypothetical protein [Phenylobacterium sp. SCN 70-31]